MKFQDIMMLTMHVQILCFVCLSSSCALNVSSFPKQLNVTTEINGKAKALSFDVMSSPQDISQKVCAHLSNTEKGYQCSLKIQSIVRREIDAFKLGSIIEGIRNRCSDVSQTHQQGKNLEHVSTRINNLTFVVDQSSIGPAPYHAIRHCGTWRPGMSVFASAVSSLNPSQRGLWVEISGRASAISSGNGESRNSKLPNDDDVAYFTAIGASLGSSVHVFEPDPIHVMRTLSMARANFLSEDVAVHSAYVTTSKKRRGNEVGVHMCVRDDECDATVKAIETTIDRALLPALYQEIDSTSKRVRWINMRVDTHRSALDILNGTRKLLSLHWIDFVMVDRRIGNMNKKRDRNASIALRKMIDRIGLVSFCMDSTILAIDFGKIDESSFAVVSKQFEAGKLPRHVIDCDALLVSRSWDLVKAALSLSVTIAAESKNVGRNLEEDILTDNSIMFDGYRGDYFEGDEESEDERKSSPKDPSTSKQACFLPFRCPFE